MPENECLHHQHHELFSGFVKVQEFKRLLWSKYEILVGSRGGRQASDNSFTFVVFWGGWDEIEGMLQAIFNPNFWLTFNMSIFEITNMYLHLLRFLCNVDMSSAFLTFLTAHLFKSFPKFRNFTVFVSFFLPLKLVWFLSLCLRRCCLRSRFWDVWKPWAR